MNKLLIFILQASLLPPGIAFAQLVVAPTTSECATSTDGSVVGVPNPLEPPSVSPVFSGTLPSGNYYTVIAWYDAAFHVTLASPEVQTQLSATGELQISPPSGMPSTASGMQVFIGTSSGGETYQGSTIGSATWLQSVPLVVNPFFETISGANTYGANNTGVIAQVSSVSQFTVGGQLLVTGNSNPVFNGTFTLTGTQLSPLGLLWTISPQGVQAGTGGLVSPAPNFGTVAPSSNSTLCQIIANDAGWPTGTGYQVSLTTPAGNTYPGYPMQWQILGPGGTINLGNGLPLYNGVVTYPVPILAYPYGHATQSIAGGLNLGTYPFFAGSINGVTFPTGAQPGALTALLSGQTPIAAVVLNTGGGTGASISCSGCIDAGGTVRVVTGTSPAAPATIFGVTFGATHSAANCLFKEANPSAVGSATWVFSAATETTLSAESALSASTTYQWTYSCSFQ